MLNPARANEFSALSLAAMAGHFEVCQYLIDNLDDKNPKEKDGNTVLLSVALAGHLHIYKYIHRYYSPTDKLQGKIGHKKKATTEGRGGQRHGAPGDLWDRYKADRLPINYNVWSITKRISQHKVWEGGGLLHQLDRPLIDNRVGSNKKKVQ